MYVCACVHACTCTYCAVHIMLQYVMNAEHYGLNLDMVDVWQCAGMMKLKNSCNKSVTIADLKLKNPSMLA